MPKIVANYCLHYGKEWLFHSMRSVKDFVDEIVVVYSGKPSHGHGTTAVCPDSRSDLKQIAGRFGATWYEMGQSDWEGVHRDFSVQVCEDRGADVILVVDHDEIWEPGHLDMALHHVLTGAARNYRVPFRHFWRSVWRVCDDMAMPVRFHNLHGEGDASIPIEFGKVNHYGYAQSSRIIDYKWKIHGHLPELRKGWYQEKFLGWMEGMGDVHPTNENFWDPVRYDASRLKELIGDHPYYSMDIIP